MQKTLLLSLVAIAALTACGPSPQYVQPAQQPQVIYQQPMQQAPAVVYQHDNSTANLAAGVAIGSMLSNNNYRQPETRVIERNTTVYVQTPNTPRPSTAVVMAPSAAVAPRPAVNTVAPAPVVVAIAPRPAVVTPNFAAPASVANAPVYTATPTKITVAPTPTPAPAAPARSFTPTTTYKATAPAPTVTYKSSSTSSSTKR